METATGKSNVDEEYRRYWAKKKKRTLLTSVYQIQMTRFCSY